LTFDEFYGRIGAGPVVRAPIIHFLGVFVKYFIKKSAFFCTFSLSGRKNRALSSKKCVFQRIFCFL